MSNKKTLTVGKQQVEITNNVLTIVTHNGTFHTDEVTAFTLLNYLFTNNKHINDQLDPSVKLQINLVRTRSDDEIKKGNIVVDVGQIYDVTTNRYDHHQSTFNDFFNQSSEKFQVKLSSAGLVYKHFGQAIIDKFCEEFNLVQPPNAHNFFYYKFICELDASDNGITQYSDNFYEMTSNKQITTKFSTNLNLGQIVSGHNNMDTSNENEQMQAFKRASQFVWHAFSVCLKKYCLNENAYINDMAILKKIIPESKLYYSTGELLVVKEAWTNWRKCIESYETQNPNEPKILFLVYPASENKLWNVRTISDKLFTNRLDLLKKDVLQKKVPKPNEIQFVHNSLFIAACNTLETAIDVAVTTLNNRNTLKSNANENKDKEEASTAGVTTTTTTTTNTTTTTTTTTTITGDNKNQYMAK